MSERLEQHKVRWHLRGLPIFGSGIDVDGWDEDEIKGYTTEDEWKWADLTADEQAKIETDAKLLVIDSAERTPDNPITYEFAYSYTLSHFGIACPHRWVDGAVDSRGLAVWRECKWCKAIRQPEGIAVQVGDVWMRVEDPPPRSLVIARPPERPVAWVRDADPSPFGAAIPQDEYEWNGRRYIKI